jgi:phosphatidylserine decarboxylase
VDFSKPGTASPEPRRPRVGAAYSALIGWTATRSLPARLRPLAYRAFARAVGANLDEVELALDEYPSLGDFFARGLRRGAREIDPRSDSVIAPCDGVVAACGAATDGTLFQAKGRTYRLAELLADDELAARLTGGDYATIYLSPRDYHRVHAPIDARIVRFDYLPGALWPVNPRVSARRDALLARNERVVMHLNSEQLGDVAVVMVGAAGVGNIRLAASVASGVFPDSASLRSARERYRAELTGVRVRRGDELGAFRLGSTVVMAFSPGRVKLDGSEGQAVQFGERFGRALAGSGGAGQGGVA